MYGKGLIDGLKVTWGHFVSSFKDDFKWGRKRYYTDDGIAHRSSPQTEGIFTIQYPEEKLATPEEFRYIPFLIYDDTDDGGQQDRCTSCGICAKVCPPQCIWIDQTNDPVSGRPVPEPKEFYIDIDICMNCGFCAEFCPFDAIKMDHIYELSLYNRLDTNIYNKATLSKSSSYYASIRPTNYAREEAIRAEKEAKKAARGRPSNVDKARGRAAAAAQAPAAAVAAAPAAPAEKPSDPEEARKARLERARARQAARKAKDTGEEAPTAAASVPEAAADTPAPAAAAPAEPVSDADAARIARLERARERQAARKAKDEERKAQDGGSED
jgi:NADH-quinone oxidoreductase subunit I